MNDKWNLRFPILLMAVFALTRWPGLMPHNFSAAYAIAFCAGIYFAGPTRWILPLGTLLFSDVLLNAFVYHTALISPYMLVNYGSFAAIIWLGNRFSPHTSWLRLVGGGFLAAVIFYVVTNSAAWLQNPAYPKSFQGWIQALTTGIPGWPPTWQFFRNTLLSGGLFTALFTGAMKLGTSADAEETEEDRAESDEAPALEPNA